MPHCGCMKSYYRDNQSDNARVDLTGKRFGSLVVTEMIYQRNEHTKVRCVCDCGNEIVRVATYLTSGNTTSCGCLQKKRASEANTKDYTGIISDHGIKFTKRLYQDKGHRWVWECECYCGRKFEEIPAIVLNGHTTSCGCSKQSSGERLTRGILDELGIAYEEQYKFNDCRDIGVLPFDFYIPLHNIAIEVQGQQHYSPISVFGGEKGFELTQKHDEIKKRYCDRHCITLLELPYSMSSDEIRNIIVSTIYP